MSEVRCIRCGDLITWDAFYLSQNNNVLNRVIDDLSRIIVGPDPDGPYCDEDCAMGLDSTPEELEEERQQDEQERRNECSKNRK